MVAMTSTRRAERAADTEAAELVQRCRQGDSQAWTALVERYARLVHSVPVRYGLTPADVADVGQEVFLALAQNLHAIEDPHRLPAWLITTARRLSWRMLQRQPSHAPIDDGENQEHDSMREALVSPLPTPEGLLAAWDRQQILDQALQQMNQRCRDLLTLAFLDPTEPSYDEISARLAIPKGSIGPTRLRCLQALRAVLANLGYDKAPE